MKARRSLLLIVTLVLAPAGAGSLWMWKANRQYALNRQLIAALVHNDSKQALALVNAGADPNTRFNPPPAPSFMRLLRQLLHNAPPGINDSPTALTFACGAHRPIPRDGRYYWVAMEENLPLIQAMLAHGAGVNTRGTSNSTALRDAAMLGRLHTAEALLLHGANPDAQDAQGDTPLIIAVLSGHKDVTHLLLAHKADPNKQDMAGNTALHFVLFRSDAGKLLPDLLARGANPTLSNKNGASPLLLAQRNHRPDLVALLRGQQ